MTSLFATPSPIISLQTTRRRVFGITWLSYATYYLTRKNLAVAKVPLQNSLGITLPQLAAIDTVYLLTYALAQFAWGPLADRFGARRILATGMGLSALATCCFAASRSPGLLALWFGVNGFAQAAGWLSGVKAMASHFPSQSRGRVMGLWSTNYQLGGVAATALAAFLVGRRHWQTAFWMPAVLVAIVGALVWLKLPETAIETETHVAPNPRASLTLLRQPRVWILGIAYAGLKLTLYTLMFWLPFYLHTELGFSESHAGYVSCAFDAGGVLGALSLGWAADFVKPQQRAYLAAAGLLGCGLALLVYWNSNGLGIAGNAGGLFVIGMLLLGPDALVSSVLPQDMTSSAGTGTAAGLINGMGSLGAVLQGTLTAWVSQTWGWQAVFYAMACIVTLSACGLFVSVVYRPLAAPANTRHV